MSIGGIPTNQNSRIAERYHEGVLLRDVDLEKVGLQAGDARTVTLAAQGGMGEIDSAGMSPAAQQRFKKDLLNPDSLALDSDASYLRDKLSPRPVLGPTTPLVNFGAYGGQFAEQQGPKPIDAAGGDYGPGVAPQFTPPNGAAGPPPGGAPPFNPQSAFTGQAPAGPPSPAPQIGGPPPGAQAPLPGQVPVTNTPAGFYNNQGPPQAA